MYGTLAGTISGTAYYLYFQLLGISLAFLVLRREALLSGLLTGSAAGSLLAVWLAALLSFFFDFTLLSHMLALLLTLPALLFALLRLSRRHDLTARLTQPVKCLKAHGSFAVFFFSVMLLWVFLLYTHTLLPTEGESLSTGQCTYGDMNMHLGFITSLARQHTFPPDYSIMPGVRLSYPFLSDSISSALLLFGASLRAAYILPMLFAMAQILTAVYLFAAAAAESPCRARSVALLVLILFFFNGGLGFSYFLDWSREQAYRFSDIFTGFYTTPTNLINQNIRWVNIIADMLLPQRATLFGYAVLFPFLWLLYRAVFRNRRELFLPAGLFAAALPMIHTHSFLTACVISAVWMLLWLLSKAAPVSADKFSSRRRIFTCPGGWVLALFVVIMCLIQHWSASGAIPPEGLMAAGIGPFAAALILGILLLVRHIRREGLRELLQGWGIYAACLLLLALPQLLFWTFGQVARGGFLRGHFNWGNQGDFYPWFYLKNIGITLLPIIGAACTCSRKRAPLFLPALFLWWLGELVVFTPNTYDNNKILYPAYLLLCIGAADYVFRIYDNLRSPVTEPGLRRSLGVLSALFLFSAVFSAVLTLGREAVSRYRLYSTSQVSLAGYAEENTPPDAVYLTGTRHNNEITSLSGRNIVCGADSFLYFHGLDTTQRKADLKLMYEAPLEYMDLFQKYNVSYVVISAFEREDYQPDEAAFRTYFTEIFSCGDTVLYRVPDTW